MIDRFRPKQLKVKRIPPVSKYVDQLGKIKALIADLEEQEDELKLKLVESGLHDIAGRWFHCTVSTHKFCCVDYKAILAQLPQTSQLRQLVKQFTKRKPKTVVKVSSR